MSSPPGKLRVFLSNLAWLLACLPGWLVFHFASRHVRWAQRRVLARILEKNSSTEYGRKYQFESISTPENFRKVPLTKYEDYIHKIEAIKNGRAAVLTSEPIQLLQPSSGSTAATKLIPYTQSLRREFKAAIDPWIASLYLTFPSILFGHHYWSISPSTPPPADPAAKVRIGFADDSEYLGFVQRLLTRMLFAVPPQIARVSNQDAFEYLTLLFLCREKNLRLISVWHPSFFTVLLKALPDHLPSLLRDIESGTITSRLDLDPDLHNQLASKLSPCPARAEELAHIDTEATSWPQVIWPRLRVISCWTDGISEPWLSELAKYFPQAKIQGKGLTATEGIISFPVGQSGQRVCAIRSHFMEFIDPATEKIYNLWEVETGKEYSIVLTTGGGLYRYRLHDRVRVTGFFNQAPCLEFLSRDNLVSDMVGEKLNARHVEECIHVIENKLGQRFKFAMLAPLQDGGRVGYVFFIETDGGYIDFQQIADLMEDELRRNYHYHHARSVSQLEPLRIFQIARNAEAIYRRRLISRGMKVGDIKFQALSTDPSWINEFSGEFGSKIETARGRGTAVPDRRRTKSLP